MRRLYHLVVCALAVSAASCSDAPPPLITSPMTWNRAASAMGSGRIGDTTAVIYSNFGPDLSFDRWSGVTFFGAAAAMRPIAISQQFFTPPGDYQFVRATLALRNIAGNARTRVYLQADSMGVPGRVIEAMLVDVPIAEGAAYTVNSMSMPVLADSLYWLTVAPGSPEQVGAWLHSVYEFSERSFAWTQSGEATGPWSVIQSLTPGAFRIEGRAIGSRGAVMHQASGGGSVVWETPEGQVGRVTWAVSAQSMINGNTTGQFLALAHDGSLLFKGSVSCLVVVRNRAYLTVDITQAPSFLFDPMPARFALGLEDNGEGRNAAAPDRVSLLRVLYEDDPVCQRVAPSLDWTNGNAQVR